MSPADMVTTLNITLDDDVAERVRDVKEANGLTWAEFVQQAAEELDESASEVRGNVETSLDESSPVERVPDTQGGRQGEPGDREEIDDTVEETIAGFDFGKIRKGTPEGRRDCLRDCYRLVREKGQAKARHIKGEVYPTVEFSGSDESWYENFVKDYLPQLPNVRYQGGQGDGTWHFVAGEVQ